MTLQELLDECRNNINSEVVFQEIVAEHDRQIRAEERKKVLNAVYDCGWSCEVHTRKALDEMVEEELKEQK